MSVTEIQLGIEEGLLTLRELATAPEIQAARLSYSRIRHWVFVGINGRRLPSILIGHIRYTTIERTLDFALHIGQSPQKDISGERGLCSSYSPGYAERQSRELESLLNRKKTPKGK